MMYADGIVVVSEVEAAEVVFQDLGAKLSKHHRGYTSKATTQRSQAACICIAAAALLHF